MEGNFKICVECNQFLNEIYQFVARTKLIDAMFTELSEVEQVEQQQHPEDQKFIQDEVSQPKEYELERSVLSIRQKFGLKPIIPPFPTEALSNLFDEQDNDGIISTALEIKLESEIGDFDVQDALSEDQEQSESSEEEDDESEIEQLSDSQLRKHEESLQFQDDSSDSGREDRKKLKKKPRKSDEEKLFE